MNESSDGLDNLKKLHTEVFDSKIEPLALALNRPAETIESWLSGAEEIDEDSREKINGIAKERLPE